MDVGRVVTLCAKTTMILYPWMPAVTQLGLVLVYAVLPSIIGAY